MAKTGRPRRVTCRRCEKHVTECGPLSARGFCDECGVGASIRQQYEMAYMQGESLKRWRARSILAAGGILPDDLKPYA